MTSKGGGAELVTSWGGGGAEHVTGPIGVDTRYCHTHTALPRDLGGVTDLN